MNKDPKKQDSTRGQDANPDPITGAPGSHPVGTGVGAAGGAAAGAAIGAAGGPVGAGIGIAAGAIIGGLAGKAVAERVDPTVEDRYWRENHPNRPYAERDVPYEE
jgi:phage tail tape-measure protein